MLNFNLLHDAIILPPLGETSSPLGGVVDREGCYVESSCPNLGAGGAYTPLHVAESQDRVIYLGWINDVWGHVITDVLKKLWFLHTDVCKQLVAEGVKLVYITHLERIPKHVSELLQLADIDLQCAERIDFPTRYSEVFVPDDCFVSYSIKPYFMPEYKALIAQIVKNVAKQREESVGLHWMEYKRVYFTRTHSTRRFSWRNLWMPKEVGEERLEKVFAACDYQIIAPEQLSVAQQIYLLMKCDAFAATEGSISHNAIFCAPGTKVAVLKKEDTLNVYTSLCNAASEVRAEVLNVHASWNVKSTFYGPFYLYVTRSLKGYLEKQYGDVEVSRQYYWLDPLWYWYMIYDSFLGRVMQKLLRRYE